MHPANSPHINRTTTRVVIRYHCCKNSSPDKSRHWIYKQEVLSDIRGIPGHQSRDITPEAVRLNKTSSPEHKSTCPRTPIREICTGPLGKYRPLSIDKSRESPCSGLVMTTVDHRCYERWNLNISRGGWEKKCRVFVWDGNRSCEGFEFCWVCFAFCTHQSLG